MFGLGPPSRCCAIRSINDILVNTFKQVYVERSGKLERVAAGFQDDKHLMRVIDRIVSAVGRRVDDSSPMVDARLPDGSRVNAIIAPLAVDGPLLSIRRFPAERLKGADLVNLRAITQPMLDFVEHRVRSRLNVLVSGVHGAGKTTLLNVMSSFISERERIARSRTPPSCSSIRSTWRGSRRVRRTSKARARSAAAAGHQRPASRSHRHRRRGPWRGSARHAPGDEHGP